MAEGYPKIAVGVARGIEHTYQVDWISEDLVYLTEHGDVVLEFGSSHSGGFRDVHDVLDQAQDIVAEWDVED